MFNTRLNLILLFVTLNHFVPVALAAESDRGETCDPKTSMRKRALVVGGTSGIGTGIASRLANRGVDVTIAGRNEVRGREIVESLKTTYPSGNFKFEICDCFQMDSVKKLAEAQAKENLDYLVMTQGMATIQGLTPTEDGFDQKLQLHYYSRVLLASLLAPSMSSNSGSVLSVLSAGVHGAYKGYEDDVGLTKGYSIKNAADLAGFYNDIALEKLAQEFSTMVFAHASPGFVNTNWGTEMPTLLRWVIRGLQHFGKSQEECGELMVSGLFDVSSPGLHLLDEHGKETAKKLPEHDAAKAVVNEHTAQVLKKWLS